VLLDPRIGALHRYSGIESKIFSDPVGVLTPVRVYIDEWDVRDLQEKCSTE
jgi:hypothetical protein